MDSWDASEFLPFAEIRWRCQKFPTSTRDKIAPAAPDRVRSQAAEASTYLLRHKSTPEYRSSDRRGFVRPGDKVRSAALRRESAAMQSCPTNRRNAGTNSCRKFSGRDANARSLTGANYSSAAQSRERRSRFAKAVRLNTSRPDPLCR